MKMQNRATRSIAPVRSGTFGLHNIRLVAVALLASLVLAACGSGVSVGPQTGGTGNGSGVSVYANNPDVQSFQSTVWSTLRGTDRCGSCHNNGPNTSVFFVNSDVNVAYAAAANVVDRGNAAASRMVTKVRNRHHCWSVCDTDANEIARQIDLWVNGGGAGSGGTTGPAPVVFNPPAVVNAGGGKSFSVSSADFATYLWPTLTARCSGCHTDSVANPQAPYFAHSNVDTAYLAIVSGQKVNLDNPSDSRLVVRLRQEFHNCWDVPGGVTGVDCATSADAMQTAIENWAAAVAPTVLAPGLVVSKALTLRNGIVASGGARNNSNVIAFYEFKTGEGYTAYDTSGVSPAIDLTLEGTKDVDFQWVSGWGIEFKTPLARALARQGSSKLYNMIAPNQEYSVEAWVVPANVTQEGPAGIISYSSGSSNRNFTLGQTQYQYEFLNRSTTTSANGTAALITPDADEDLQATLQHVAITYDRTNGRRIYVNGAITNAVEEVGPGVLSSWDDSYALVMGADTDGGNAWAGKLRMVAIYNRAMTQEQITANFDAGVGEKFYMLFSVADLTGITESYVMFEVSEYDNYAYLFTKPRFIVLSTNPGTYNLRIKNLSIGLNGKIAASGQAFRNIDATFASTAVLPAPEGLKLYNPTNELLPPMATGTVIAKEKGAQLDQFFLAFEIVGGNTNPNANVEPTYTAPADSGVSVEVPDLGLRTFEEINSSMAAITGVSPNNTAVKATYTTIQQQLPTTEDIRGFLSSHQVAISQLAIGYCNAMVSDNTLRAAFFTGFDFGAAASTAFNSQAKLDQITDPLLAKAVGANLVDQPTSVQVKTEVEGLINRLATSCTTCDVTRTATVAKAACAAVLGGANLLIQ